MLRRRREAGDGNRTIANGDGVTGAEPERGADESGQRQRPDERQARCLGGRRRQQQTSLHVRSARHRGRARDVQGSAGSTGSGDSDGVRVRPGLKAAPRVRTSRCRPAHPVRGRFGERLRLRLRRRDRPPGSVRGAPTPRARFGRAATGARRPAAVPCSAGPCGSPSRACLRKRSRARRKIHARSRTDRPYRRRARAQTHRVTPADGRRARR